MIQNIEEILPMALRMREPRARGYKPVRYDLAYETEGLHPQVTAAHRAVQWWLNDILHGERERRRWVALYGKSGVGKSHLVYAAYLTLKAALPARSVQVWGWSELYGRLVDGGYPGLLEQVQEMPVLMLDDVGAEMVSSERAQSVSMRCLMEVLDARLGRWTMVTSNLSPDMIPDPRLASRMFRGLNEVVDMSGAGDYGLAQWKERRAK